MDVVDLVPVVHLLEDNVDDLEELLEPLFKRSLEETSRKLPLLERAKLQVLLTTTLESLIFSYLSLRGINAKEHPVYRELTRVKQYFIKIKALETEPEKPTMKLDQDAARRFISHGLAGNEQYDKERAEKLAKEKARAQFKAAQLAKQLKKDEPTPSSSKEPSKPSSSSSSSESESESEAVEDVEDKRDTQPPKSLKPAEEFIQLSSEPLAGLETAKAKAKKRKEAAKARKAERKAKIEGNSEGGKPTGDVKLSRKERRRKKNEKKKAKRAKQNQLNQTS